MTKTIPLDIKDYLSDLDRRLRSQERRAQPMSARDLLGAGASSRAIRIEDWNAPIATYNGNYYTEPNALHTPNPSLRWTGTVIAKDNGSGMQQVWNTDDLNAVQYRMRTYVPDSTGMGSTFSDWKQFATNSGLIEYDNLDPAAIEQLLAEAEAIIAPTIPENVVYRQNDAPTNPDSNGRTLRVADQWIDTNDSNKPYIWDGDSWEDYAAWVLGDLEAQISAAQLAAEAAASAAADAMDFAEVGVRVFRQPTAPVSTADYTITADDVWFDTDDSNRPYARSGGAWVVMGLAVASEAATDAQVRATAAQAAAIAAAATDASTKASAAQSAAISAAATDATTKAAAAQAAAIAAAATDATTKATTAQDVAIALAQSLNGKVLNGSFEEVDGSGVPHSWAIVEGVAGGLGTEVRSDSPTGSRVLRITGGADRAVGAKAFPVIAGRVYFFRFRARHTNGTGTHYWRFNYATSSDATPMDSDGYVTGATREGIHDFEASVANTALNSTWVAYSYQWTATISGWVSPAFHNWGATTGDMYVDDVRVDEAIITNQLIATAIDGMTITGALQQTETTAARGIKTTSTGMTVYNSSGVATMTITASTGAIAMLGSLTSGSTVTGAAVTGGTVTGAIVQSDAAASTGIKLSTTALIGYGSGVAKFTLDATTGNVTLAGTMTGAGVISGPTLRGGTWETEATASRGIKVISTGLTGYNASGVPSVILDAATGSLALTGTAATMAINSAVVTGGTVQTDPAASTGIKITSTGLTAYGSGIAKFTVDSSGNVVLAGSMTGGGTITGPAFQTHSYATTGVKITSGGLTAYNGSGVASVIIDATNGNLTITGTAATANITGANIYTSTGGTIATDDAASTGIKITSNGLVAYGSGVEKVAILATGELRLSGNMTGGGTITGPVFQTASSGERIVIRNDGSAGVMEFFSGLASETAGYLDPGASAGVGSLQLRPPQTPAANVTPYLRLTSGAARGVAWIYAQEWYFGDIDNNTGGIKGDSLGDVALRQKTGRALSIGDVTGTIALTGTAISASSLAATAPDTAYTALSVTGSGWSGTIRYARSAGVITVTMEGVGKASWVNGEVIATLPAGFRPGYQIYCYGQIGASARLWGINTSGQITTDGAGTSGIWGTATFVRAA